MREELEKLIAELRIAETLLMRGGVQTQRAQIADKLQAILDADAAGPVEPEPVVTHADLCWLSRIFNSAVRVGPGWGRSCEVNDWLKAQIAARKPAQIDAPAGERGGTDER